MPLINDTDSTSTAPPSALCSKPPRYSEPLNGCFSLQQAVVGRRHVCVPFQLSGLREILKDLGSYNNGPDQYIKAFISVIPTFELT
jgi:hypothetical protein